MNEFKYESYYKKQRKKSIKNIALFYSNAGNTCGGNPLGIYRQLVAEESGLKLVWIVKNDEIKTPDNSNFVVYGTKQFWKLMATTRFIITDTQLPKEYRKRKPQRYVRIPDNTPLKKIGLNRAVLENPNEQKEFVINLLEDARRWSYLAIPNKYSTTVYNHATAHRKKKIKTGTPQIDELYNQDINTISNIKQGLNLENEKKIVFVDVKTENYFKMLELYQNQYSEYYFITNQKGIQTNLIEYKDVQFNQLALISDVYITDYRENVVAYANLQKPMIMLQPNEKINDYYLELEDFFPGKIVKTTHDLDNIFESLSEYENYAKYRIADFNLLFNTYENGMAAQSIISKSRIKPISKWKKKVNKRKSKFVWKELYPILQKLPIEKNTVVFESFLGRAYSDNPKAIYEYMEKNYPEMNYVWFLNDPKDVEIPGNVKMVKKISFSYIYYLARAKYVVSNSRMTLKYDKRDSQVYIQTWHGTPLKKLVLDMENVKLPGTNKQNYLINFLKESQRWDYLISANEYSTNIFNNAFAESKIVEIGYPRNDILVNHTANDIEKYRSKLGLTKDDKVLLYAPTFRDNKFVSRGNYKQQIELDLEKIKTELPDWKILLRTHYLVTENMDHVPENVIYVSNYDDINHLYLAADALMTDYSSVFFDYSILDRPMIFFAYDLKEYEGDLRGFYLNYEQEIPGKNIKGTEELINVLSNLDEYEAKYYQKRQEFREKYNVKESGTASKYIAELIRNGE